MSMKSTILGLSLALAFGVVNAADPVFSDAELKAAASLRDAALTGNLSYKILESLTTEVGPRMAGSPADARAVAWGVAKFKELGFDKVWTEPVTFPAWKRGVETAEILAPFPQPLSVTALGHSVGTPAGGISAEVVRFATLKDMMEAPAAALKGKIAFIDHKMAKSSEYGYVQQGRSRGASEAAKKGALALVIRSVGTDSHRLPHTGVMRYEENVAQIPAAAISNPDADLLTRMLARGKPVSLKLTLGAAEAGSYTSQNVIGEITGSDKPDEYVVIGGHLDSWDLGTGAIDDGAGVAITMGAAEFIKRQGLKPKRTIRVVLFANEENGLLGGAAYAKAHEAEVAKIQAAAEADSGQGPAIKFASFVAPEALPLVKQMYSVLAPLGLAAGENDANPGPDMGALKALGVASFGIGLDNSDYFNLHHTPDDTFDKIEPKRINQTAATYAAFAWMAANAPISFGSGSAALKKGAK
ncbi:M20/M25/M40 family metallo-hydrolase [Massilia sp. TS11]|uniref:M20/M25/M40 family metallo-hydrolase n=1 Tax=Massilia sp. TS11 TaxID=2908003 RepID=UPI001EDBF190|nr:M20/M25/M40 family metallo-hydrolase [Massilia sp. TS11]MCG2583478.1 M20/M25/M40 family metallo-hydrolase [Massilia sp. TS11]